MNFLIGFSLLVASALIGCAIANGYKRRLNFLRDMDAFILYLQVNCAFLQDSVKKVLNTQQTQYGADFNQFLCSLGENLDKCEEFLSNWQRTQKIVSKDEAKFVVEFWRNFGKLDSFSQMEAIKSSKQEMDEKLKATRQLVSEKGMMSIKLGVVLGIGLFIICV